MGKGGGSAPSGQTTQVSSSGTQIPPWLQDYAATAANRADFLSQRPYDPYTGQQVATAPADTQAAYQAVRDMQGGTAGAYGQAQNLFGQVQGAYQGLLGQANPITAEQIGANANQLNANYNQNVTWPTANLLSPYLQNAGPATAQQVGANAQQLMSPYTQSVIDPTRVLGQQALAQNLQQIGAGANQAGAFGGSRQGIQEGVAQAQNALGQSQYLGNLLNNQWNNALTPAYNLASQQAQQGYGAAGLLGQLMGSGYNQAATQGAGIANTNLGLGTGAISGLQGLGTTDLTAAGMYQGQQQKDASLMQTIGGAQQQQAQNELNAQMGNFYQQQDWPIQNLDLLVSTLGGIPYGTTSSNFGQTNQPAPKANVPGQVLGGLASGAGIANSAIGILGALGG